MSGNDDLAFLSATQLSGLLANGEISSVEVTRQQLARLRKMDAHLNAYITVLEGSALEQAREADRRRGEGEQSPLLGVPVALKDLFETAGVRTTAGSRLLSAHIPNRNARVVESLRWAGAVVLGKTNMMEFAYGYPHPDFGETRNPWDLGRTAGGSSGGSAAAVAAGIAYAALGTDTGGSVRSPAAYCGIVGLKPTYGAVSRQGAIPLSWSLDHVGPLTRSVADAAMMFDAIAGYDLKDPGSVRRDEQPPITKTIGQTRERIRIGMVEELFERHVNGEIGTIARGAAGHLESIGFAVESVSVSLAHLVGPTIMPILQSEATSYHWQSLSDPRQREQYGPDLRDNLLYGATVLARDYLAAQRLRRRITEEVTELLREFDALIFPTQPIVAPTLDAYGAEDTGGEDVLDVEIGHTGLANLTGHPAVSVPCGFTSERLPVGLQFTGRSLDEQTILRLAHAYESTTEWHRWHPSV